jgi:hypothetical protein
MADQIWMDPTEENQEVLRNSQVIPDLLKILIDSRNLKHWIQNPWLPMLKYAHMIMILQPPNWHFHFEKIQSWIVDYKIYKLEPKVTGQEFQAQIELLAKMTEETRKSWEKNHPY